MISRRNICCAASAMSAGGADVPLVAIWSGAAGEGVSQVFERIVNQANDAIIVAEHDPGNGRGFKITYANEAFGRIFGYARDEVIGQSPRMLQGPETCGDTIKEISQTLHQGAPIRRRILNYGRDGQRIWVDVNIVPLPKDGDIRRFAAIERDITLEVGHEHYLTELAFADPLTKLGNRRFFEQTLQREMARSRRFGQPLSLAILDIDHFKSVNDSWGHPVGDRVLAAVAHATRQTVRAYDHVARIGGEEFAVLLPAAELGDARNVLERICAAIRDKARVDIDGQTITVTCSAGLTSLSHRTDDPGELIRKADRALYVAKSTGRNRVVLDDEPEAVSVAE
jgi:diguanylate cyclase (GGDEF)-like protein/PAS domain S-box-containing protein